MIGAPNRCSRTMSHDGYKERPSEKLNPLIHKESKSLAHDTSLG